MSRQKQVKELIHAAKQQDWEVELDGAGHYRLTPPGNNMMSISISCTPSDYRTVKNEAAKLKRMGLKLPGQKNEAELQLCAASWHDDDDSPIGFCNHCRGRWKTSTITEDVEDLITNFEPPAAWFEPKVQEDEEEVIIDMDEGSIRSRVLKSLTELSGEFLSTSEVAAVAELPKEQVGPALRVLFAQGAVIRSKRGRYGVERIKPTPVTEPTTEPTTEPEETEVQSPASLERLIAEEEEEERTREQSTLPSPTSIAPPDVNKPWSWTPGTGWVEGVVAPRAADAPPLYEGTGLRDGRGRPVIKDEAGDLFVAVPLVLDV